MTDTSKGNIELAKGRETSCFVCSYNEGCGRLEKYKAEHFAPRDPAAEAHAESVVSCRDWQKEEKKEVSREDLRDILNRVLVELQDLKSRVNPSFIVPEGFPAGRPPRSPNYPTMKYGISIPVSAYAVGETTTTDSIMWKAKQGCTVQAEAPTEFISTTGTSVNTEENNNGEK